jgi:RNA polymerase sigma-70 factor (ECF subfamily)
MPTDSETGSNLPPFTGAPQDHPGADSIPTRESLLSRLKDWGDRESWQDFFDTYWRLIYNMARKAGLNDAEAQDIVQETVLSVARKIEGFRYDPAVCSFRSWMLQITRWRIINQWKKRNRDGGKVADETRASDPSVIATAPIESSRFELESIWNQEWEKNLLKAALERVKRQIDAEQFQIFDLYCVEQMPAGQVARMLGVSVARVYLVKHRVSRVLKREIERLEAAPI